MIRYVLVREPKPLSQRIRQFLHLTDRRSRTKPRRRSRCHHSHHHGHEHGRNQNHPSNRGRRVYRTRSEPDLDRVSGWVESQRSDSPYEPSPLSFGGRHPMLDPRVQRGLQGHQLHTSMFSARERFILSTMPEVRIFWSEEDDARAAAAATAAMSRRHRRNSEDSFSSTYSSFTDTFSTLSEGTRRPTRKWFSRLSFWRKDKKNQVN